MRGTCLRAVAAVATLLAGAAQACGLEDPGSIGTRRGVLSLSYPEALHVGTAIWQAQLEAKLPRDPVAQRADLTPEARGALRMVRANTLLRQFADRLAEAGTATSRPSLAVVLLGPVMWTRLESRGGAVNTVIHVPGPAPGDVVVVTDLAAIEAVAKGGLRVSEALEMGVMRLYGPATELAAARGWLMERTGG